MKLRVRLKEHRTAEAERLWLLSEVNSQFKPGRTVLKRMIWIVAFILLISVAAVLVPRFRKMAGTGDMVNSTPAVHASSN